MNVLIKTFYKVMYNYFNNQKKHPTNPRLMAWGVVSTSLILVTLNFLLIFYLITGIDIKIGWGRGSATIIAMIVYTLNYIYLFKALRVDEMQKDSENGFLIPRRTTRIWWFILIGNFFLFFGLALLKQWLK